MEEVGRSENESDSRGNEHGLDVELVDPVENFEGEVPVDDFLKSRTIDVPKSRLANVSQSCLCRFEKAKREPIEWQRGEPGAESGVVVDEQETDSERGY